MRPHHFLNTTRELQCVLRESRSREDIGLLPLQLAASAHAPGSFVEVGDVGSQTWLLEKCFGWRGVLIEGDPAAFAQLERTPRRSRKVHSAMCNHGSGHIKMHSGLRCEEAEERGSKGACRTTVPCKPLTSIMRTAGFGRAHFLSLDIEVAEDVLEVIEKASPFPFDVVLVEAERGSAKNERVRALLRGAGLAQLPIELSPGTPH